MRNSVKATVDAYDGTVTLYQVDRHDPVLQTWMRVFPGTVKPEDDIPDELRAHFRYPEDLFNIQRALLAKYHVDEPREFFTTNAFWSVPSDPTNDTNPTSTALLRPRRRPADRETILPAGQRNGRLQPGIPVRLHLGALRSRRTTASSPC